MLTQQFLVLHNIRIDDQMPGGANCSYADSWFTGALWDKSDDDFQWTRSAWLQCKRAKTGHMMLPIGKFHKANFAKKQQQAHIAFTTDYLNAIKPPSPDLEGPILSKLFQRTYVPPLEEHRRFQ